MKITYNQDDTNYVVRNNRRFEAYTYEGGDRHLIMGCENLNKIEQYARNYHYKIIIVAIV
jgi:hypothetical protein